jgi:hypothetical protein
VRNEEVLHRVTEEKREILYVVCLKSSVNGTRKQTKQIRGVRWVDFFLFPRLKSIMIGARFADVAAIQERVTAVLR